MSWKDYVILRAALDTPGLRTIPDIVLEVIHTNPILDELHVHSGFGVPEATREDQHVALRELRDALRR